MNDQLQDLSAKLSETGFLQDLLSEFVIRGLGSLPGRETTISIVRLLLKHNPEWTGKPPKDYELARLLRTSPRKIRNIRDELAYRDESRTESELKQELKQLLKKAEKLNDGTFVAFQIDDGLLRDFAADLVRQNAGIIESGINGKVVKLSGKTFLALTISILGSDCADKIQEELKDQIQITQSEHSFSRIFFESLVKSAGDEIGRKGVSIGFSLLSGGLSDAIVVIKGLLQQDSP